MRAAYDAAMRNGSGERLMAEFTNEQLFFLWFARKAGAPKRRRLAPWTI